jgi:hypothetical protein
MNSAQRLAQRFNFPLVSDLLAFGQFDQFEHFFHLVERLFERLDNLRHFFNRLADGGRRGFYFSFGQCRRIRGWSGSGNWFRSTRAAPAPATVATPPPAARTSWRRGRNWFGLLVLRHCWREHDAPPDKSKGEL